MTSDDASDSGAGTDSGPGLHFRLAPRTASALVWGAAGALSFLVLVQGYALLAGALLSLPRAAALALLVGVATVAIAYALERRVAAWAAGRNET